MATAYYTGNGDNTYRYWITAHTGETSSSTTAAVWNNWANSSTDTYTVTSTGYGNNAWYTWVSDTTDKEVDNRENYIYSRWAEQPVLEESRIIKTYPEITINPVAPPPYQTSEQVRAEKVQRVIDRAWRDYLIEEDRKRKETVEMTAQKLLLDLIGEEELKQYQETDRLIVHGRKFDYVIRKSGGVYRVEKGKIVDLCIHLKNRFAYPVSDNVIGLKLMIEASEYRFNRLANDHGTIYDEERKQKIITLVNNHRKLVHKEDVQNEERQAVVQ